MSNETEDEAISMLLKRYYLREDLQKEFPEVKGGDYQRLIDWAIGVAGKIIEDGDNDKLSEYKEQYLKLQKKPLIDWKALTKEEEGILEKKMVWIFGSPRSGSTWLATQLLKNPENIVWDEPYIGVHFTINREYQIKREDYIFS